MAINDSYNIAKADLGIAGSLAQQQMIDPYWVQARAAEMERIEKERKAVEGTKQIAQVTLRQTEDGYLVQVNINGRTKAYVAEDITGAMNKVVAAVAASKLDGEVNVPETYVTAAASGQAQPPAFMKAVAAKLKQGIDV